MVHTVRGILGINLVLGLALAVFSWAAAPYAAGHIAASCAVPLAECLASLRIAGALILVRAVETVGVSTQRAFEHYRTTVQISTAVRLLTLAAAAVLALSGRRTVSILAATGVFLVLGTFMQFRQLRRLLGTARLWPAFEPEATRALLRFGAFVWLQTLGGLIFAQFDRILLGISMGALAVAPYSLCVQFAQPLAGLTASGLNFLFPYLSKRAGTMSNDALRRTLLKAFACNLAVVACGAAVLLLAGDRLMRIWAGAAVAQSAAKIFPSIVLGSALIGISVTGVYALQALGLFRKLAFITLGSRAALLPLLIYLLHQKGLQGLAISRVCLGSVALLVYLPLWRFLAAGSRATHPVWSPAIPLALQEGSKP